MLPTLCSARLADQQTHCTEYARHDLCLCTTHIRERERSVRDYKLAGERAESLRPQAVLTLAELKSIQPVQADAARKATENYLDAVKEEARLRVAHTKRFYADGPVDGHHRRVEVLLEKVVNGMRFVDQLRDHKRGLEQTKAAERRRRMTFAGEQPRRREELDRRLHAQPRAGRAWQEPPQPYYSYSARSSARGASGPSLTVLFLVFAAIYFVYLLVLFWANHPVPASDHGGRSNVIHTNTNAFTRWAASQVSALQGHFSHLWRSELKQCVTESAAAPRGVREWILSALKAVGGPAVQLTPCAPEPQVSRQSLLVGEARKAAESAMDGAQRLAQVVAGEAQKLAANAVADVGKRVQEGLGIRTDEVKQLVKSLGIRW